MKLKKEYTLKVSATNLDVFNGRPVIIHSKELQEDGYYLVNYTEYNTSSYEFIVNKLVKEKYSDSEEFAILRKSISNPTNEEYLIYNAYVEECKIKAKEFIAERDEVLNEVIL